MTGAAMTSRAMLVVGHGSRDADGVSEFWTLAATIRAAAGDLRTGFGFMELASPTVDEAIDELVSRGATEIVSVPLVLLAAGHLKNDGPSTLARARARHSGVRFWLARDLGIEPHVLEIAADRIRHAAGDADPEKLGVALIGRGSSDPDACADLWKVSRLLADGRGLGTVEPGFVSVATPSVPETLERLRLLGTGTAVVAPFFLFPGVLVNRIHAEAAAWAREHPEVEVRGAEHLGSDPRLARLVLERYREARAGDVRMNCDLCAYRVQLPGYESKVGTPISLTPHGDGRAGGPRRGRRTTRPPAPAPQVRRGRFVGSGPVGSGHASERPAIEVRDLDFAYPDGRRALSGVSMHVQPGERVALLGPNGAGKTSLVLQLNGVLTPSAGSVLIGGVQVGRRTLPEVRRRVGVVFQDPDDQLFTPTVGRDVAFGPAHLGLSGSALEARVTEALSYVGLADAADRPPHRLSLGERRRAAVATVLAMHPEVLVLDEPTANLDPAARRELADLIKRLGMTTLLVTHDLPYALELCPRTLVIDHGQIVADGLTREVLADTGFMSAHRLELPTGFNPLGA
ncbi:MAG: ATP-binding cassette domain-containing protein [Pseudonocardiales bacterium]|nr:ATP-binding cassette domain-containing protein [Pseudonocardiales bacterium]MBV9029487.1 ATP-binding cassette domain-containing protein [Pseudonocardiales bacterium]MBW0008956.1 ATP-binding cassette domain-containing protein [Pseudonocardiales bacterium]